MHRPPRGAGAIGEAHYRALFGEPPPDKKKGPHSRDIEASRNSKHDPGIVARNVERGKGPMPPCPDR